MINLKSSRVRPGKMLCSLAIQAVLAACAHAASSQAAIVSVYECVVDGRRTFSDQPCGPGAQHREIADSNRMVAQDTRILSRHQSTTRTRQAADDEIDKRKAACNKIREQQKRVESQQRSGYSAKQGELLRARHDSLAERYISFKCERYR